MKKHCLFIVINGLFLSVFLFFGCATTSERQRGAESDEELTVGTVQREIRIGMSAAEVAEVLGSPNIVTTDEERREVWIYDKISSEVSYSERGGYGTLILIGGGSSSGKKSTSQKTLTIIIKYDEESKVRDFAYHTSRF
jgi:outer membrane protein assembly factor BamE (lipoprotein component of BamABCDE complex)